MNLPLFIATAGHPKIVGCGSEARLALECTFGSFKWLTILFATSSFFLVTLLIQFVGACDTHCVPAALLERRGRTMMPVASARGRISVFRNRHILTFHWTNKPRKIQPSNKRKQNRERKSKSEPSPLQFPRPSH